MFSGTWYLVPGIWLGFQDRKFSSTNAAAVLQPNPSPNTYLLLSLTSSEVSQRARCSRVVAFSIKLDSLHVFDGLPKLFALIYFQSVADQAAKLGKAFFIDSGEVEAGLALHPLPERRRDGFDRRRVEIKI
jgi:hypothetical protein